ncbi:hypothetical protein EMPS_04607 [Entomortierella parvispora]|uniref:Smr domain-containing protein n=1 Tax=Entomortierella parvispora TaxID=205924 RepID=A0A9P3LVZ5_9FUNG|nr:hypothetical protein EMPS_04607 [Entomortierella parvispora]
MGSAISTISESATTTQERERYRELARKNAALRYEFSQQSQAAYQAGNGAKAKELSLKAKEYGREMDRYNDLAKNIAFNANNASRPPNELDLHGLKVTEALDITRDRLRQFVRNNEKDLIIIVGKGNNSANGIAKIKPAVTQLVNEFQIKATPNKPNEGCIYVEPRPPTEQADLSWLDGFFGRVLRKLFRFLRS